MIDEKILLGFPIPYKFGLTINVPKVKDVLGNPDYYKFLKIYTISQEDIEDELTNFGEKDVDLDKMPTPFEFLLINSYTSTEYKDLAIKGFEFFTGKKITFLFEEKIIVIGDLEEEILAIDNIDELKIIREEDYFDLQNTIRKACGEKQLEPYNPSPIPKIRKMKQKARYRDFIKAKNSAKENKSGLGSTLLAISLMGVGINLLNIGEISYPAIKWITRMYQDKEKYDLDVKSLLAGASSQKVKPKYWIHDYDD